MKTTYRIALWFGGAGLLVALMALWSFSAVRQSEDSAAWQKHTLMVMDMADSFLSGLKDAETAQRGYLLTGDETYLEPYLTAHDRVAPRLAELRRFTQDNPAQQHRLDVLAPLIEKRLALLTQTIALRRDHHTGDALKILRSGRGKQLMDGIRVEMRDFNKMEKDLLAQRDAQYSANLRQLLLLIAATSILVVILTFISVYLVYRETRLRLRINEEANKTLRMAHDTLRASEENLSVTLNSIGDGVLTTDAEGRVTLLNPIAERLTGWSQTDALEHPVADIFHIINQQTRQPALIPVAATLAQGVIHGLANDTVLISRDGSECAIADSCAPIRNRDGAVIGAVLVFHDVTQEYAAQAALRHSEERYRTLFEAMDEGFCVVEMLYDATGKTIDYRFVEINPAFEKHTGLLQALGKTIREMVPDHDAHWFELYGEVARTGVATRFEDQARAMGRHYDVFAFRIGGEKNRRVGILFRDITEKKMAELALVAAKEQAELASHAKDSFLATMSHEIRTPLTGMLGMLELLSMTRLDHDQEETLRIVWDSSRSLLRIVNDILDWSKIEEGKLELSPQPTSISQLLQEIVNTYSRVASSKSLVLSQHADARLSAAHIVDPLRLSQVLNNFVSNALRFTQRGEIELRAELLERFDSGERVRFSVKDTGIGIGKEAQQHLFQRYRQESVDTARMYGGTGLGLAICRRLADLMDGQINLVSQPGRGSIFSIILTLPVSGAPGNLITTAFPEVERKKVKPLLDDGLDAPLVLAVDDHPINRYMLARQIRLLGLRAETAENGQAALSLWRTGRFALVITDCHMPEMDGYALTRTIRQIEAGNRLPHTPVIAWTANALAEENELIRAAGMDELLVKPTNLAQLKKILATWLHIAETDSGQPAFSRYDADGGQNACPIDYAVLSHMVPDRVGQIQVLRDFQAHIHADRTKLLDVLEQDDRASVEHTAHRMKGSSRMVGAADIARACGAIEQAARAMDMAGARVIITELDEAIKRLQAHCADVKTRVEKADEGE